MSTVIEQPRSDVPIVTDATLLQVPNMNDEKARAEYLTKIRALRNSEKVAPESQSVANQQVATPQEISDQPEAISDDSDVDYQQDAIQEDVPVSQPQDVAGQRIRLSPDDLTDYEIPVTDEDGNTVYLSYDEFNKTVGTYSKQNKKSRELAEREREVEAIKSQLLEQHGRVLQQTQTAEAQIVERYQWVQNSIAHAHQYGLDVVKFEDGSTKKVTQLIAEKTALENGYTQLQAQKAQAQAQLAQAQEDFVAQQNRILDERAPNVKKSRTDIAKFLERSGFTSEEANALSHAKAELLIVLDKAMKFDAAQRGQTKEKRIGQNTKIIKQSSRLAGRGQLVGSPQTSRMSELQAKGAKATADELRELRRLQLQRK